MGCRCVRGGHGKGLGLPGKTPVLKKGMELADSKARSASLCASPARAWRGGGAGGAAGAEFGLIFIYY